MINALALDDFRALCLQAEEKRMRAVVIIEGTSCAAMAYARDLLEHVGLASSTISECSEAQNTGALGFKAAKRLLGQETESIILHLHSGFDPDVLGVVAGTIRQGGVLCVLVPPQSEWVATDNPQYRRLLNFGESSERAHPNTFLRLMSVMASDESVSWVRTSADTVACSWGRLPEHDSAAEDGACAVSSLYASHEQQSLVACLHRWFPKGKSAPFVVTADRGRGKSYALGLFVLHLAMELGLRIAITSSNLSCVYQVFEALQKHTQTPEETSSEVALRRVEERPGAMRLMKDQQQETRVNYYPEDVFLREKSACDLLLVDEAASLPVFVLDRLLAMGIPVIFSSTVHGYEGAGKGFGITFQKTLAKRYPRWEHVHLSEPVRWDKFDPLEPLLFKALLLDAEPAPLLALSPAELQGMCIHSWAYDALQPSAALSRPQEEQLNQVMGLLVQAHYQTRPLDMMRLLDVPNQRVLIALIDNQVAGVLWACREGGIDDPALEEAIYLGRRRPQGHLVPNSLICHEGMRQMLKLTTYRVTRIVVHPNLQNRGIGGQLLTALHQLAIDEGVDYLSSSFALTPDVLRFWTNNAFNFARWGSQKDAASGLYSGMVLRAVSSRADGLVRQLTEKLAHTGQLRLRNAFDTLDEASALALFRALPRKEGPTPTYVAGDVTAFALGSRPYETCEESLWMYLVQLPVSQLLDCLKEEELKLLMMKLVLRASWRVCSERFDLTGKAACVKLMRGLFRAMLSGFPDSTPCF